MIKTPLLLTILACLSIGVGCSDDPAKGWSTKSIFTNEVKTVSVPIAANTTQYRQIGFQLTDAVIKEIESRDPMEGHLCQPGRHRPEHDDQERAASDHFSFRRHRTQ